jgi:hypothetical protein
MEWWDLRSRQFDLENQAQHFEDAPWTSNPGVAADLTAPLSTDHENSI